MPISKTQAIELDTTDLNILKLLQHDQQQSIQEIAQQVHLTTTPCWKRIKRLEQLGVIRQ